MKKAVLFILLGMYSLSISAQLRISAESGLAFNQYNDVRAPNGDQNKGTFFSLTDDFEPKAPAAFFRAEAAYTIANRHTVHLVAAPLKVNYQDYKNSSLSFSGTDFDGDNINASYKFNTYRLSYRYRILDKEKFKFELGATGLLRDAKIEVTQGNVSAENTDLGFVPLLSFYLEYQPMDRLSVLLKGDALAAPQGRAEDVFLGVTYGVIPDNSIRLKAGYRLIEGGGDVDQVYAFAMFHFIDMGMVYIFE